MNRDEGAGSGTRATPGLRPAGVSSGTATWRRFACLCVVSGWAAAVAGAAVPVDYAREVAPIFRAYCAGCHNDKANEGKLSLERYSQLRRGGEDHGDPVKPGTADESFLIRAVEGKAKPAMPPKDEPQVPARERETLRRWIAEGAPGPAVDDSILRTLVTPKLPGAPGMPGVTAAAISADGRRLALARGGNIELRDGVTRALHLSLTNLPGRVNALHFSPDGSKLVAATGVNGLSGLARLFRWDSGAAFADFAGHSDILFDAEFSPDGTRLATAGYDRVIRLWRVADAVLLREIDVHKGAVYDLAWHPEGKVLASASADETVKLWRVADGLRLDTLNQAQGELRSVLFTPDGRHVLAAGTDKRIHLWSFVSRDAPALNPAVHSRFAHESPIHALALTPDGRRLVSAGDDLSIKLWSVPGLELLHTYPSVSDVAGALVSWPDGKGFFVGSLDGRTNSIALVEASPAAPVAGVGTVPGSVTTAGSGPGLAGNAPDPDPAPENEPNDDPAHAQRVGVPTRLASAISRPGDADVFRFRAMAGSRWLLEVDAARSKSKLDSRVEVLHADGTPVEQVVLQATRDSWFTFRGKDSDTADDFRLHNWAEMELNEYLYANGEVVKLWLYPRGPDSGFKVYPGEGKRETYFSTSALVHALGEPCYVVSAHPPGTAPAPNGLPIYRLHYVNDDDSSRRFGSDSVLLFTAPADGEYLARVTDVRGFGAVKGFEYQLAIRPPNPDFKVTMTGLGPKISPGSGREITFKAERYEGFEGPIRIGIEHLPPGFSASTPIEIEAGQVRAVAVVRAALDAVDPDEAADKAVLVTATARVGDREVRHELGSLGNLQRGAAPKVSIEIAPSVDRTFVTTNSAGLLEFSVRPGRTITALARARRHDFAGRIEFGNEDSGRNLPYGVYVDNIGLNGLLIIEGQTEREFFITASRVARPGTRMFHLRTSADDGQASRPVVIRVLRD